MNEEIIEQLELSRKIVGEVNPMVVDWDGELLSGQHRKQAGWVKTHKVDSRELAEKWNVTPLMAKGMLRIHLNIQRKPSREETQKLLMELAKELEKTGIQKDKIASELVKIVPYSQRWIEMLLPQELKRAEKAEAGKLGAEVVRQKMLAELVQCDRCYMASRDTTEYKGELLCPRCLEEAKHKPMRVPIPPKPPVVARIIKPKETWSHRKAQMSQPISKMDEAMLVLLQQNDKVRELGYNVTFQKPYCITEIKSDVTLEKDNDELACFFDGDVHRNRQERDELNRQKAADRHHIRVLPLPYTSPSSAEQDRLLQQILKAVKRR